MYLKRSPYKVQVRPKLLQAFQSSKVKNENESMSSEIRLPTLTSDVFLTKNPMNKLAMNNRRLLIAAQFHYVHPVEKDS